MLLSILFRSKEKNYWEMISLLKMLVVICWLCMISFITLLENQHMCAHTHAHTEIK